VTCPSRSWNLGVECALEANHEDEHRFGSMVWTTEQNLEEYAEFERNGGIP
jgi:hypothetical protein